GDRERRGGGFGRFLHVPGADGLRRGGRGDLPLAGGVRQLSALVLVRHHDGGDGTEVGGTGRGCGLRASVAENIGYGRERAGGDGPRQLAGAAGGGRYCA